MADGATIVGSKAALPAFKAGEGAGVKELTLLSNETQKTVNITTGLMNFSYYESILQDVVRATVTFMDTGDRVDGKTVMEGLRVYGSEAASIWIEDNNKKSIKVKLFVNKPDDLLDDTRKRVCNLNFASKEFFDNEKIRVNIRFDGKIANGKDKSEEGGSIEKILKTDEKFLNTQKEIFIEKTSNERNFIGNNWKCFYIINWLATQSVPSDEENPEGVQTNSSAGFMFWETADGFHFKSIDGLMNTETNPVKRRFIYNETAEGPCSGKMPEGYDAKVLEMTIDNRVNVQQKLKMGAYSTRTWTFNPYNSSVEIIYPNAFVNATGTPPANSKGNQDYLKLAGKKLPFLNKEFNNTVDFSRTEFMVLDVGSLPEGNGSGEEGENQQLGENSKIENSKPLQTLNQGNMRINQLFASKVVITIPGDFELHAGDAVYFDAPGLRKDKKAKGTEEIDKHISGNYIIASICHYLDGSNTLTKIDLVRDSFGRKPQKRVNVQSLTNEERDSMAGTIVNDTKGGESYIFDSRTQGALDALSDK